MANFNLRYALAGSLFWAAFNSRYIFWEWNLLTPEILGDADEEEHEAIASTQQQIYVIPAFIILFLVFSTAQIKFHYHEHYTDLHDLF